MKNTIAMLVTLLSLLMPSPAEDGASPKQETPSVWVDRYSFLEERVVNGKKEYRMGWETGVLFADGTFKPNHIDEKGVFLRVDEEREFKRKFSGKWLAVDYDFKREPNKSAFKIEVAYRQPRADYNRVVVTPANASEGEVMEKMTIKGVKGVTESTAQTMLKKVIKDELKDAIKPRSGWFFEIDKAIKGTAAIATMKSGTELYGMGQLYMPEAQRLLASDDPELRKSGETLDHLALWLTYRGLQSMSAFAPGKEGVWEQIDERLKKRPAPVKDTILFLGLHAWVWDGVAWQQVASVKVED